MKKFTKFEKLWLLMTTIYTISYYLYLKKYGMDSFVVWIPIIYVVSYAIITFSIYSIENIIFEYKERKLINNELKKLKL